MNSPWFCPPCRTWVGYKRDRCAAGHDSPRIPVTLDDVETNDATRVTRRERYAVKLAKLLGLRGEKGGDR